MVYILKKIKEVFNKLFVTEERHNKGFIVRQIEKHKASKEYQDMLTGERYFQGKHDILNRNRVVIGQNGEKTVITNLPNNRIVDNQYRKMVTQKSNYLVGRPFTLDTENKTYSKELASIFNRRFYRVLKNVCEDSLNCGLGYMFVGFGDGGLKFTRIKAQQIIPIWEDADHERLEMAIRVYSTVKYKKYTDEVVEKVEVYSKNGIDYYDYNSGVLKPCEPYHVDYFYKGEVGFNWDSIPIVPFKYNASEIPLINMVKSLQDGINTILSTFQNNMEEDARNTIMVLVNYDGENLGEFRQNLATYGAVKIKTVDGAPGDVRTLQVEVNSDNYKAILELFKKAIIENAMGYDAKDDRLSGNANQLNIQSMYSDIDLDANGMETEYQASFEELIWFVNAHLFNSGVGNFEKEKVEVIFNRDMLMNESEIIDNLNKSMGILSTETIVANHPWVTDATAELAKIEKQNDDYGYAFKNNKVGDVVGEEK